MLSWRRSGPALLCFAVLRQGTRPNAPRAICSSFTALIGSELKEDFHHCQATAAGVMPVPCSEVRDLLVSTKLKAVLHEHKTVVVLKDSATVEQALTVCS